VKQFSRQVLSRNPVWMVPLALPIVLYASQSVRTAILFGAVVVVTVPIVHGLSYFAERRLPRYLRIVPLLVIAATVLTLTELLLERIGEPLPDRTRLLLRAVTVTGIMIWPTVASRAGETLRSRVAVATGLAVGFVVGFAPLAAVRIALSRSGYILADSVAIGFLMLAIGRGVINIQHNRSGAETVEDQP
jgi:Na+-translocating ferredoxin:NAD+ oxidoreductase RnfA subunit